MSSSLTRPCLAAIALVASFAAACAPPTLGDREDGDEYALDGEGRRVDGAKSLAGDGMPCPMPETKENAPGTTPAPAPAGIRFGVAPQYYQTYAPPGSGPGNVDSVVVGDWLIQNGFTDTHKTKIASLVAQKKVPYLFGYIMTALTKKALGEDADCDGNPARKLCIEGASWIRSNIDGTIVPAYKDAAQKIGAAVGGSEAMIHIEPDYFQFSEKAQQNAFTRDESNGFINKILGAIKEGCPTCKVVVDFSPWFSADKTQWATSAQDFYAGWDRSVVKYVGLTGKQFAFTEGKVDNFTYKEITAAMGVPLVVIDAYTFGGGPIDVDRSWLDPNALTKAKDMGIGYVFLSQQGDVGGYDAFISSYRAL